jgi:hypothetical protein
MPFAPLSYNLVGLCLWRTLYPVLDKTCRDRDVPQQSPPFIHAALPHIVLSGGMVCAGRLGHEEGQARFSIESGRGVQGKLHSLKARLLNACRAGGAHALPQ